MKTTKETSYKIQILRGIAIVAVVFIHNTPGGMVRLWCRPFVNFSVGCFLFLSGMLSSSEKWSPKKRIVKIAIPYAIWTLIYTLIYQNPSLSQIPMLYLKQLCTGKAAAIMYYVFVYCELTLLIPLIDRLARSKYKWSGFLISPLEIIIMRLIPLALGYEHKGWVSVIMSLSCLGWFVYFYLGYLLGNEYIHVKLSPKLLIPAWAGTLLLQVAEGYGYYLMGDNNYGTQLKLSALLSGCVFVLLAYCFISSEKIATDKFRIMHKLGDLSFGIFFFHLAIMAVLKRLPYYSDYAVYPFNALITVGITALIVMAVQKVTGRFGKYIGV